MSPSTKAIWIVLPARIWMASLRAQIVHHFRVRRHSDEAIQTVAAEGFWIASLRSQ